MTTTFILVRHGQTDWNKIGRCQGQDGADLNDTGKAQALNVARQLTSTPIHAIYTSDQPRCIQTAHLIANDLKLETSIKLDNRWRELYQGKWQGMTYSEIEAECPDVYAQFRQQPHLTRPPGGETLQEMAERVLAALHDMVDSHANHHVMVVSHEFPIAVARLMAMGKRLDALWEACPANGEITLLQFNDLPAITPDHI